MTNKGAAFEAMARPLLEVVHRVTGLETTFVTAIDWDDQTQEVVLALNLGAMEVVEGGVLPWTDSMCRRAFLSGKEVSADVQRDYPGSIGAEHLGMQTFFALPIVSGHRAVGTLCGASRRVVELEPDVLEIVRLVGEALTYQFEADRELGSQRVRADDAEELARTDPLTGLANRRAFTARLEEEMARSGRHGHTLALLAIDIDEFKSVNDEGGHSAGDRVLAALGNVLRTVARREDFGARIGGDEFALVLPETGHEAATAIAARLTAAFARAAADLGVRSTVSVGVSSSETAALDGLVDRADQALYEAKRRSDR